MIPWWCPTLATQPKPSAHGHALVGARGFHVGRVEWTLRPQVLRCAPPRARTRTTVPLAPPLRATEAVPTCQGSFSFSMKMMLDAAASPPRAQRPSASTQAAARRCSAMRRGASRANLIFGLGVEAVIAGHRFEDELGASLIVPRRHAEVGAT